MSLQLRLDGALAKIESAYATDAAPVAGTDGVRIAERVWNSLTLEDEWLNQREDVATGTLDHLGPAPAVGRKATIDMVLEVRGPGARISETVLPEANALIQACGYGLTVDDTTDSELATYVPVDTGYASATIWAYAAGWLYKIVGCRGNMKIELRAGQIVRFRFQMQGIVAADPASASLPQITYDAVIPPAAKGIALTIDGTGSAWSPDVRTMDFDTGNRVELIDDANAPDGIDSFDFGPRKSMLTVETRTSTSYDPYTEHTDAVQQAIDFLVGADQYNQFALDINGAYHDKKPDKIDYKGFTGWRHHFHCPHRALIFS